MKCWLSIVLLSICAASPAVAGQRELEGPAAEFGGQPGDWESKWTLFEPADGTLEVQLEPAAQSLPAHLKISVSTNGGTDAGSTQHSVGLFRALHPKSSSKAGVSVVRFQIWLDDIKPFKLKGAMFGFSCADTGNIASLSSRSTWNLICYGTKTDVGGVVLQAGELALRVMSKESGLTTIPTGILMESGTPVEIVYKIQAESSSYAVTITQGAQTFEKSDLGFWSIKPAEKISYLNSFFSCVPNHPYTINVGGLSFDAGR